MTTVGYINGRRTWLAIKIKCIILISIIRHSLCTELTLPLSWCDMSQMTVSNTVITTYSQEGQQRLCRMYKYESVSGLITKVSYKQVLLYSNSIPLMSHSSRVVYEMIGDDFEVVVITMGNGTGLIEGAYYIKDNKVYDVWSLDAVINDELRYFHTPLREIVREVIYSKLPDMRYMHSFGTEPVHTGELIIAEKPPLNNLPNITIDSLVCIVMNRVLVGQVTEPENEETEEVVEHNEPLPLDYSLRKRN
ncbi:hypothetical protein MACK_001951 [Theileria orientalis]|uniref:Uncharacterized protein n=1 Tax=Theileria orientalis TaxID=68886 RepID=A0A976MBD0_THEOR|nr:hypothetical protein MACK_001951 [Theileria orientalis]